MSGHVFGAVDVGASGGRVMAGIVDDASITLDLVHRFTNGPAARDGHLRWDVRGIYREIQVGLRLLPAARSVGIDTWGVDYGLLDDDGRLLAEPIAYRDDRTTEYVDAVHAAVSPAELYALNGLQHLPFNTIYQLAAERDGPIWRQARHAMLLADLFGYWLTGVMRTEVTNASTTGLLDPISRKWAQPLLQRLEVPVDLFPALQEPGELRGHTSTGIPVVAVGSHDTASAVVGVPATTDRFAYVACGTWSLVGVELDQPICSEAARSANFTNEAGVDGRTRFLRNVGGLWLLQECMREWCRADLVGMLETAARLPAGGPLINVDDPAFIPPGRMPDRIATAAGRPLSPVQTVRCVVDSLSSAFAHTIRQAAALSGAAVDVVHLVGGGSQNELLCQLTADAVQLPVIAGPAEATAVGNIIVQAQAAGVLPRPLERAREAIASSTLLRRYDPS